MRGFALLCLAASADAFGAARGAARGGARGLALSRSAAHRAPPSRIVASSADTHATIVFLRHGQSMWNEANLFTGWADVPLTTLGKNEAAAGATQIWREGIVFDVCYTSLLKRAQQTLDIVLTITGQEHVITHNSWRLNERMYGALTGLDKKQTVAKYGEDQVKLWRRSFSTPPPPIDTDNEHWPGNDNRYAHIPMEDIPRSECLKDTIDRTLPYWQSDIMPALKRGKTICIAAHGAARNVAWLRGHTLASKTCGLTLFLPRAGRGAHVTSPRARRQLDPRHAQIS